MKKQLIIALVAVSCSMSLQAVESMKLSQHDVTRIWARLHSAIHCIKPADLIPSNGGFNNTMTVNGLTMTIESTRVIGDKVMLSGKFVSSSTINLRGIIDIYAITPNGNKLTTTHGTWAGENGWGFEQIRQEMQADIPVSFDMFFSTNGENINELKLLSFNLKEPENSSFIFRGIQIPIKTDPNLSPGCIEIYKNLYLKFKKQTSIDGHLKIYFSIINKSSREIESRLGNATIIDASGDKFSASNIEISGQRQSSFPQKILPDVPISGCFDFTGNIPFANVKLLQFSTNHEFNFAIKQIVFEP